MNLLARSTNEFLAPNSAGRQATDFTDLQLHGARDDEYNRAMRSRMLLAVAVWYFVLFSQTGGVATQIGPFANEAACSNYRAQFASNGGAAPCFSTTAKQ